MHAGGKLPCFTAARSPPTAQGEFGRNSEVRRAIPGRLVAHTRGEATKSLRAAPLITLTHYRVEITRRREGQSWRHFLSPRAALREMKGGPDSELAAQLASFPFSFYFLFHFVFKSPF
jgi:hypothetical protein